MRCLILKPQGPKLEKCRSYRTKRYINYNDALRPNILVVWGALCGYIFPLSSTRFFKNSDLSVYVKKAMVMFVLFLSVHVIIISLIRFFVNFYFSCYLSLFLSD